MKTSLGRITTRLYIRLLATYIIVTVIILLSFSISYKHIANTIRQEKISEMLISMQHNCKIIDEQLGRTERLLQNTFLDEDMRCISSIQTALEPSQYPLLLEAHKLMCKYELTGGIITECIVAFNPDSPFLLTTHHIVTNPYDYYNSGLFTYNGVDYNEFKGLLTNASKSNQTYGYFLPNRSADIYNNGHLDVITLVLPLRIPGIKKPPSAFVFINSNDIKNMFATFTASNSAGFCIIDAKDNILLSSNYTGNTLPKMSGETKVFSIGHDSILCVSSQETNLTYYMSVPEDFVNAQMKSFWLTFYLVLLFSLIIATIISCFFTYFNLKPVSRILRNISQKFFVVEQVDGAYSYIEKSFDTIIASNADMTKKLTKLDPVIKSGLYERLFKGGVINEYEYDAAPEIRLATSGLFYVVIVGWKIYPGEKIEYSINQITLAISDYIEEYFKTNVIHPLDGEKVAILLTSVKSPDKNMISKQLAEIAAKLSKRFNMLFAMGIGGEYGDISLVNVSCFEARRAFVAIKELHSCRVKRYDCLIQRTTKYDFPFEYMGKLYNFVLSGDKNSLKVLLLQIYNINFNEKQYNEGDLEQFYEDLIKILDKVSLELPIEHIIESIPKFSYFQDVSEIIDCFVAVFEKAATVSKEQKPEASKKMIKNILDYIDDNYNNPDISLKSLAVKFSMSDKYMSLFFKEKAGANFSKYIENKRLIEAVRLINETNKSISDVYELVGYSSSNTFYKAFYRKYGMSPTLWRDEHLKNNK